jgi:hypothetical protein
MAIYLSLAAVDPIKIPNVLPVENTKWERISTGDYILIRCDIIVYRKRFQRAGPH